MRIWVRILIYGACTCLVLAAGGAWLFRFGFTSFSFSNLLVLSGFGLGIVFAVLAVATMFVSVLRKQPYGLFTMFVAFVICFSLAGYAAILYNAASIAPPLFNISTDLEDPPAFSATAIELRGESNPVELSDRQKEQHKGVYDDVRPLVLPSPIESVYAQTLELVNDRGWDIITQNNEDKIEATATTFWFGFKDDVVIRIRANDEDDSSTVDMHSVSRFGLADLGKNADRIRDFLDDLQDMVEPADD